MTENSFHLVQKFFIFIDIINWYAPTITNV